MKKKKIQKIAKILESYTELNLKDRVVFITQITLSKRIVNNLPTKFINYQQTHQTPQRPHTIHFYPVCSLPGTVTRHQYLETSHQSRI